MRRAPSTIIDVHMNVSREWWFHFAWQVFAILAAFRRDLYILGICAVVGHALRNLQLLGAFSGELAGFAGMVGLGRVWLNIDGFSNLCVL